MTIEECEKRKKEMEQLLKRIEILKLAVVRFIDIENRFIEDLKKKGEQDG